MGWIIAAIIAIVFVQVMDLRDMVDTVKRIRKLEEEHDHLADKCGKAIKSIVSDINVGSGEIIKCGECKHFF